MYNTNLHFHFIGIGGSGMSGLAEILLNQGFQVSGSDLNISDTSKRLTNLGAEIFYSHESSNLSPDVSLVVFSAAIANDNPELEEARKRNLPIVPRSDLLAELVRMKYSVAVAGSHGKTSTASMIAAVMEEGGLDPTAVIGGIVHTYGSTGKLGKGDYLVAEADESDRSFLKLKPTIAVVTNIDNEHLEAYENQEQIDQDFFTFASALPFYGLAVLCNDDPRTRQLSSKLNCRQLTYGFKEPADVTAKLKSISTKGTEFSVYWKGEFLYDFQIKLIGEHFMQNALAAICIAKEFGISNEKIFSALQNFKGVSRRIEILGEKNGVTVINDYAHHPAEIKATLNAVSEAFKNNGSKVYLLFQPHRYSRTSSCWHEFSGCFEECDVLLLSDIYPAGESPLEGVNSQALLKHIAHPEGHYYASLERCLDEVKMQLSVGDVLICMGAGSVGSFAPGVLDQLP